MSKRRIFQYKKSQLDESFINLTPLIDVVFVVLVAFILIAPLLEVDNIVLAEATESSQSDISHKSGITIHVREDDSIWINNRLVTDLELVAVLREVKRDHPRVVPQLFHDRKATFGTYQKIKGATEKAGFETMDVILKGH